MRAIIQRVTQASVEIENQIKAQIGTGILVLLGIEEEDTAEDAAWLAAKIVNLRIFGDNEGLMNLSLQAVKGDILLVSQFTLHARVKKGSRPSFVRAARPDEAVPLYEKFISLLEDQLGRKIRTGEFGALMKVSLVNDGPVTIFIDTKQKE